MPNCLECGGEMTEFSRKALREKGRNPRKVFKAAFRCQTKDCVQKGKDQFFLDDGMMVIPLPDSK